MTSSMISSMTNKDSLKQFNLLNPKYSFVIIEDLIETANVIESNLKLKYPGCAVRTFASGRDSIGWFDGTDEVPDLVLIDRQLEDMMGENILKILADNEKYYNTVKIVLTALTGEGSEVLCFNYGADDYVKKPFNNETLLARINMHLENRKKRQIKKIENSDVLVFGDFIVDYPKRLTSYKDRKIELTTTEFKVLQFMAQNPRTVFSRDDLLGEVWAYDYPGDSRTVDVTIARTRKKIAEVAEDIDAGACIVTRRGSGYCFDPSVFESKSN